MTHRHTLVWTLSKKRLRFSVRDLVFEGKMHFYGYNFSCLIKQPVNKKRWGCWNFSLPVLPNSSSTITSHQSIIKILKPTMKMKDLPASSRKQMSLNSYLSSQEKKKATKRDVQSVGMPLKRPTFRPTQEIYSPAVVGPTSTNNHRPRPKQQPSPADDGTSVHTATTEASSSTTSVPSKSSRLSARRRRGGCSSDSSVISVPVTRTDRDKQRKHRSKHFEHDVLEEFLNKGGAVKEDAIVEKVWFDSLNDRFQKAQQQQEQQTDDEISSGVSDRADPTGNTLGNIESTEYFLQRGHSLGKVSNEPRLKEVRFNLNATQLIPPETQKYLEEEDIEERWYSEDQIAIMRENTAIVSKVALLQNTATLQAIAQAYQFHATNQQASPQSEADTTTTPESIQDSLIHIYRTNTLISGLEHICLASVRGDVKKLMLFGLEHARSQQPNDPEQRAKQWAHVTRCISAPSAQWARDVGLALATALEQTENGGR